MPLSMATYVIDKMVQNSPYASVPVSTIPLHQKVFDALQRHSANTPRRIALISAEDPNINITYEEIYKQSNAVASFLTKRGFGHLNVGCLVLANSIPYTVFYLGALKCGGVISGASAMFTDFELGRQFADSRCSVVITDEDHLTKVQLATKSCDSVKTIICVRSNGFSIPLPDGVIDYNSIINTPIADVPKYKFSPDDMALLPYSSGTTGSPKGVMLSHKNFGTMIDIANDHFEKHVLHKLTDKGETWDWTKESMLLMLPFYHIYGFGVMNMSLVTGATGIVFQKFDPLVFLKSIQTYKVKFLMLVPPIVLFMVKHPVVAKFDVSSVRCVTTGAAPCGKDLCEDFLAKFGHVRFLAQGYGMTESGMASHLPLYNDRKNYITAGVIGANSQQKIVCVKTGKDLPDGERGEICVRGPTVMLGYLNRPDATAETLDKEGWLHTGDIGYLDKQGQLFIVDRLKELIKVKGLQVPPAELEDLLVSHPSIQDAAVIGIPDEKAGELPKAYIVRSDPKLTARDVQKYIEGKVSSYKFLAGGVEFINEIPKSPAGKILRRFLREKHANDTKEAKAKL